MFRSDPICFSPDRFPLLLQRLEKTDEVSLERDLGRIVALANETNPPGSIDNNNRREPQSANLFRTLHPGSNANGTVILCFLANARTRSGVSPPTSLPIRTN